MRQQHPLSSKPFAWVGLPGKEPARKEPRGHDRWSGEYTGSLDCTLTLLTPLHIGSGLFRLANGQVVKEAVRQGEPLMIPGSSLKGVFRGIAEAISLSCVSQTKQTVPTSYRECQDVKKLCVCCRLFGGLGYLGRVRFADAILSGTLAPQIHTVPPLWSPRRSQQGRKFYTHGQPATGDEPFEVVPQGAQFQIRVEVESLTKPEMCLLLTAMGILGDFAPKLGGGKPRCLGSAEVTVRAGRFWVPQTAALTYECNVTILSGEQICRQVAESRELIEQKVLDSLKQILRYSSNTECPSGLY